MKRVKLKRLIYTDMYTNERILDSREYDGTLSDSAILGSIHEIGKTTWNPNDWNGGNQWQDILYELKNYPKSEAMYVAYRITVEAFERCEKTMVDNIMDNIKRLLRK